MIIREIISLYKLNWKAHLWSLLIPLTLILLSKIGRGHPNIMSYSLPTILGAQWFNGSKFTFEKERKNGFYKTIALLPVGKAQILLSRIIYIYINCYIYLGLILPFFSFDGDFSISKGETIWIFTFVTFIQIYVDMKFGKNREYMYKASKKKIIFSILVVSFIFLGFYFSSVLKIIWLIVLVLIVKELFKDLLNYYPINRKLSEEERY